MKANGKVIKYGDNIDTDVIIPARYLNTTDHKELASHCMEDIDKEFVNKVKDGDIMVGGANFGCGSSREHAPIAIKASGISCVIAKDFARIFYRNAINIGLPILECAEASEDIDEGNEVEVDFDTGVITNKTKNKTYQAVAFPEFMQGIINAGGLVEYIKKRNVIKWLEFNIALIPGDGIGPEIISGAVTVLDTVSKKYGHKFNYQEVYMGGCAIDKYGVPLPQETVDICKKSDSVLLGAVGGPKWDSQPSENRPEKGLLGIRKALELYSNLRPSILKPQLKDASPLKDEKLEKGLNVMVVRELTGGIYFGERKKAEDGSWASDTEKYSVEEIKRIGKIAFETAMLRDKRVVSVDKANVLESSRLWRKTMLSFRQTIPEIELTHVC